jgi:hypothetical protein
LKINLYNNFRPIQIDGRDRATLITREIDKLLKIITLKKSEEGTDFKGKNPSILKKYFVNTD